MSKNIFYVEFPTYQYEENVKEIAAAKGLSIIDKRFQGNNEQCKDAPKLTLKRKVDPKKVVESTPEVKPKKTTTRSKASK